MGKIEFLDAMISVQWYAAIAAESHQKTNPKKFETPKGNTTNWSRTVSSWLQNGAFPQFDSRRVI
jgi:hypothetical protein